ncbi:rRNA pseudouridine synthase [Candidatus Saccharibacteria bacterium]|nr:rRNA pseudouridine synthase [Candidatus Saccharibacteria bacterium]
MDDNNKQRLNKFLALQLGISRRQADDLIASGKVTLNSQKAELGARFLPTDDIKIGEKQVSTTAETYTYLLLNKPKNFVCSRKRQGDNETIYEILPKQFHNLKPVGRLDKDSSGLLILTNDGDFAFQMTHPKFYKIKQYIVELSEPLQPLHQQMISDFGIDLPDGPSKLTLESLDDSRKKWKVVMSEGRNRQIRRTFLALGYDVTYLHRTNFGAYILPEDLGLGEYILVDKK